MHRGQIVVRSAHDGNLARSSMSVVALREQRARFIAFNYTLSVLDKDW